MESAYEVTLKVSGMSCSGCANAVESALMELQGVHQVAVDLAEGEVTTMYEDDKVTIEDIEEAVTSAGYTFEGVKERN